MVPKVCRVFDIMVSHEAEVFLQTRLSRSVLNSYTLVLWEREIGFLSLHMLTIAGTTENPWPLFF